MKLDEKPIKQKVGDPSKRITEYFCNYWLFHLLVTNL